MQYRSKAICLTAVLAALATQRVSLGLGYSVNGGWDTQARKDAATAAIKAVTDRFNIYGDFNLNNDGIVDVDYNAGVPTAQSNYGGTIDFGGTYPNQRVTQHELNHWLGSGTYWNWGPQFDASGIWTGSRMNTLIQQFDGDGAVIRQSGVHFYGYGLNYDSEVTDDSILMRNVALMYAMRQDMGNGVAANPWGTGVVSLAASDPAGKSAFNWFGGGWSNASYQGWSDRYFAHAGAAYVTNTYDLRTPNGTQSWTFGGDSLTVSPGGRLLFNGYGTGGVVTIKDLRLAGGTVRHDQFSQDLFQLAGKVTLQAGTTSTFEAANGHIRVAANIGGGGSLNKTGNHSLILAGQNTYSGDTTINAGILRLAPVTAVANYTFDNISGGTVVNEGNGGGAMNGNLANGATIVGGGKYGNAVSLANGASVDINNSITRLDNDGNWTVSAWVKTSTAGSSILTKGNGNWGNGNTIFYLGDGTAGGAGALPSSVRYAGGFFQESTTSKPVTDGTWHQVTYVNTGGTYAIYVDGAMQSLSSGNAGFANADLGTIVRLGASTNNVAGDGTNNFNGLMDNVQIYNQALNASQVASVYAGNGLYGTLPTTTNVTIAAGATLDLNGATQQIGALNGAVGSTVALGTGRLIVNSSANSTFAGSISGIGGSVVKQGSGILMLSGTNTYKGSTTISAGTLRLGQNVGATVASSAIAKYSFDAVSGSTVVNGGLGGTAMNGTLANGATIVAGGHSGNAVSLAGGATVSISNGITDLDNQGNWTVSAWIKTGTAGGTILSKSDGGWAGGNTIFYLGDGTGPGSGSIPSSVRYAGGFFQGSTTATPVTNNAWHQVTYVNNGGTYAIYIDGLLQPLSVGNSGFGNTDVGSIVKLGATTNTVAGDGTVNFNGLLDDVQLYGQALSPDQISALFLGLNVGPLPATTDLSIASGATLDVNGVVQQIATLSGSAGSAVTLGTGQLILVGAGNSQFDGDISGSGSIVKQGIGNQILTGTNTYAGPTTITGGTLTLASSRALATSPIVVTGGTLALAPNQANAVVVRSVAISAAGKVDLSNGAMVIDYSSDETTAATTAIADIAAGRFTSPLLATNPNLAIGYGSASDLGGSFHGVSMDGDSIALIVTYAGDTNLDRTVAFNDLLALAKNYNLATGATWAQGDSNYDGAVNFNDLLALAKNYNQTLSAADLATASSYSTDFAGDWALAQSVVPEPTTLIGLGGAVMTLASRRSRRRRG